MHFRIQRELQSSDRMAEKASPEEVSQPAEQARSKSDCYPLEEMALSLQ